MEDVNELLFKSWETFVQNTVQVAGYNKTVVCTIINDAEAIDGKFLVSDGATKFYAFTNSDPNLYKVDDTVVYNEIIYKCICKKLFKIHL